MIKMQYVNPQNNNQDGKPADVSTITTSCTPFVFNKDELCPICMERPARIPYEHHSSPDGQLCKPPALCQICCKLCTNCIYCKIPKPPHDPNYHMKQYKIILRDIIELLYIKHYPRITHIEDDQQAYVFRLCNNQRCVRVIGYRTLSYNNLVPIFWFLQFYHNYVDKEYYFDKLVRTDLLIHTQRKPSVKLIKSFVHIDQHLIRNVYNLAQQNTLLQHTPKFAILQLLIYIFDIFTQTELLEQVPPDDTFLSEFDVEILTNFETFSSVFIDPRFYTNAQILGVPINMNVV